MYLKFYLKYMYFKILPITGYYHIRQLRCIRPYLDSSTACTIATSVVHSRLDYCNSLSVSDRGVVRSCDPLKIFVAPIISLERLNLKSSNFVRM